MKATLTDPRKAPLGAYTFQVGTLADVAERTADGPAWVTWQQVTGTGRDERVLGEYLLAEDYGYDEAGRLWLREGDRVVPAPSPGKSCQWMVPADA